MRGEFGRYGNDLKPAPNVSSLNLFQHFARGDVLYEDFGVDQLLIGLTQEPMQNADNIVTKSLTDRLFEDPTRKFSGQDLVSINIMRGRDHGVPGYNEFREHCNLTRAMDFNDLATFMPADVAASMQKVYRHVDDVDLYVAGISEYPVYGGVVRSLSDKQSQMFLSKFRSEKNFDQIFNGLFKEVTFQNQIPFVISKKPFADKSFANSKAKRI